MALRPLAIGWTISRVEKKGRDERGGERERQNERQRERKISWLTLRHKLDCSEKETWGKTHLFKVFLSFIASLFY